MNFIPKEILIEKVFGMVPSLDVLADDSDISIYAKDSLGVGNPNMLINISIVGIPLLIVVLLAFLALFLAAKFKMPNS